MEGTSGWGLKTQLTHLGKAGFLAQSFDPLEEKPVYGFLSCRQHYQESHQVGIEHGSERASLLAELRVV